MISSGRHRPGILTLIIAITTILRLSDIKTDKETKVRINFSGHCASLQGNLAPATTDLSPELRETEFQVLILGLRDSEGE